MPSGQRWSSGRATVCPPIPGRGWCRPDVSRPSTACAGAPASTRWTMSPSKSTPPPMMPRRGEPRASRTTCGPPSPAANRPCRPQPRFPVRCAREAVGLLALMLLQDWRRAARTSPAGDVVLLNDQDRSLWNRAQIAEGSVLVQRALSSRRFGPYALQAAIAAVHAEAPSAAATDWAQIVGLYDVLARADPSPVVELNRAVAVARRDGPAAGLALIDAILGRGDLRDYHLAHSARADLCRRLGRTAEARASYERALSLTRQEPERRFLERRLRELLDRDGEHRP